VWSIILVSASFCVDSRTGTSLTEPSASATVFVSSSRVYAHTTSHRGIEGDLLYWLIKKRKKTPVDLEL